MKHLKQQYLTAHQEPKNKPWDKKTKIGSEHLYLDLDNLDCSIISQIAAIQLLHPRTRV